MTKQPDMNARKALDEMKLEIAGELNINLTDIINSRKTTTQRSGEVDQNQSVDDDKPDTFNPS